MALKIFPNYREKNVEILQDPDERLRKVSRRVIKIDDAVIKLANKLVDVLKKIDKPYIPWLGMAAPQLGYSLRIIAVKKSSHSYQVMINPEILEQKWVLPSISGCFSLKGLYLIQSPYWSKVTFTTLKGKKQIETFKGGMAILLKQEIDHLNGRLICD